MADSADVATRYDYGVLKQDLTFIRNSENLAQTIDQLKDTLAKVKKAYERYATLTREEKVRYDALCAFCVNSLFWMHATLVGSPAAIMNDIKSDLERVREAMKRLQMVHDSLTKRPRLDKQAAGRFVRAGLYDENEKQVDQKKKKKAGQVEDETAIKQGTKKEKQLDQPDQPMGDEQSVKLGKKKKLKVDQPDEQVDEALATKLTKKKKAPAHAMASDVPPFKKTKKNKHIRFD
uniref:Nuclear nucleic acid-binding protein C1D n=1 Tax=Anopheles dirus TaxID=7168 RepID=A0A182MZL9_9DIPT